MGNIVLLILLLLFSPFVASDENVPLFRRSALDDCMYRLWKNIIHENLSLGKRFVIMYLDLSIYMVIQKSNAHRWNSLENFTITFCIAATIYWTEQLVHMLINYSVWYLRFGYYINLNAARKYWALFGYTGIWQP